MKSGFWTETAAKTDEFLGDDFFVDELLDFSTGYSETEEQLEEQPAMETGKEKVSSFFQENQEAQLPWSSTFPGKVGFESVHESELSLQAEGLESLEWLSHFVEDSLCYDSIDGKFPPKAPENGMETEATVTEKPCFTTPVQTKARTKRARAGVPVWPVLSPSLTEPSTSSSSSTSSTISFPPPYPSHMDDSSLVNAPAKKRKKKPAEGVGGVAAQPRRCSHCGVTKTPQWRPGPLGSKTLCNACGVRYKSGRLLPEYRPACSPTFSSELHSNSHRIVLEMRRKKEMEMEATGLPPPVHSFWS